MGTNFYWLVPSVTLPTGAELHPDWYDDDALVHIGKRSAAGWYCWDCRLTLCEQGEGAIHSGHGTMAERCPKCGGAKVIEQGMTGPAAVELGFAKPNEEKPSGVRGASSFAWAQDPATVRRVCEERSGETLLRNEYGDTFTGGEFLRMLASNCPIEFVGMVGRRFS